MDQSEGNTTVTSDSLSLLIVDEDRALRQLLQEVFEKSGYTVFLAKSLHDARQILQAQCIPLVIADVKKGEASGMQLLEEIKAKPWKTVVILMTAFGNLDDAMTAIKKGAFDYISKPFKMAQLEQLAERAFAFWQHNTLENTIPTILPKSPLAQKAMIGKSAQMVDVYRNVARASLTDSSVLIIGESGTGKELVARAIHQNSSRRDKPFFAVNCGALTETLLESELFGYAKGAFTGAQSDKKGIIEEAEGGTLFLDEIGDISAGLQVRLLRFVQDKEFRPVGSNHNKRSDVRIVCATHRNLANLMREGKFREDLFYRINVISIPIPPLKQRKEDIPDLIEYFLQRTSQQQGKAVSHFSKDSYEYFLRYDWPGNIRQLEHVIERAVALSSSSLLSIHDLPEEIFQESESIVKEEEYKKTISEADSELLSLEDVEKAHIQKILTKVNFNKSKAANILGIDRVTLYRKAERYKLKLER